MIPKTPIKWASYTKYVDVETGEWISKHLVTENKYYIIKIKKYVRQYNKTSSTRIIEYTAECRKRPEQLSAF